MSDTFDHEMDAWDQALFHEDYVDESYLKYLHRHRRERAPKRGRKPFDDYQSIEYGQPEFHQLTVTTLHHTTAKAVSVTGVIHFEREYRGLREMHFVSDWLPLSQCVISGPHIRVPHWLVRKRIQERNQRKASFPFLKPML